MEFTKETSTKQLMSSVHIDERENPRKFYESEGMAELKSSVKKFGITEPFKSLKRVNYSGSKPIQSLIDGFRRNRVLTDLDLLHEKQKFLVYEIDYSQFSSEQEADKYYEAEKARIIFNTQESRALTPVEYGIIVNKLIDEGYKPMQMQSILNRSLPRISEYTRIGMIAKDKRVLESYAQGLISSENIKTFFNDSERNVEKTIESIHSWLDDSQTEKPKKVKESEEIEEKQEEETEYEEQTAVQIEEDKFDLSDFARKMYKHEFLRLEQAKAIIKLVNSFAHKLELSENDKVMISLAFGNEKPTFEKPAPVEIEDDIDVSKISFHNEGEAEQEIHFEDEEQ